MTDPAVLDWLLEPENPSARFLTLTTLLDLPADHPRAAAVQAAIPDCQPAQAILGAQWPEGYWMRPGLGYSPKYKATVWQLIFLAAMGAPRATAIDRACAHVLDHSRLPDGRFSALKSAKGAIACLNGNLLRAMLQLGYCDLRVGDSLEALAGMVLRNSFCCRFNAAGPPPARMQDGLPCVWGAIKTLGAFAEVSEEARSPAVRTAVEAGVEFLLSVDPAIGDYPTASEPSPLWHEFGFPLGYTSDLLEVLDVLARLGVGRDPRLAAAIEIVRGRQDASGCWLLGYTPENTWADFGQVGQPNKWVTLRALHVLKRWENGNL